MRASPRPVKKAGLMISSKLIFDNYYLGRLCTKTLILVSVERSVQYRERSAAVAHSTLSLKSDGWLVECATAALRSRYCSVGMLLFVQSLATIPSPDT